MGVRSFFGLFADGPGKKVRASQITDENSATVYIQAGSIADPDSTSIANVKAGGVTPVAGTDSALVVTVRDGVSVTSTAANPSTIYSGQQLTTASAAALPSQALSNGIVITAKSTNVATIYVGPSGVTTSSGYPLVAGQSISYAVTNLSAVYILGSNTTDVVAFTGN